MAFIKSWKYLAVGFDVADIRELPAGGRNYPGFYVVGFGWYLRVGRLV